MAHRARVRARYDIPGKTRHIRYRLLLGRPAPHRQHVAGDQKRVADGTIRRHALHLALQRSRSVVKALEKDQADLLLWHTGQDRGVLGIFTVLDISIRVVGHYSLAGTLAYDMCARARSRHVDVVRRTRLARWVPI